MAEGDRRGAEQSAGRFTTSHDGGARFRSRARGYASGGEQMLFQDEAKEWIRRHQDAALLTAFAVGVLIGAWMRR